MIDVHRAWTEPRTEPQTRRSFKLNSLHNLFAVKTFVLGIHLFIHLHQLCPGGDKSRIPV